MKDYLVHRWTQTIYENHTWQSYEGGARSNSCRLTDSWRSSFSRKGVSNILTVSDELKSLLSKLAIYNFTVCQFD